MRTACCLLAGLLLSACASPRPPTTDWRPVVVMCNTARLGGLRTCTAPIAIYSNGRAFNKSDCRMIAQDYNRAHFIKQKAVCRRASPAKGLS